MGRDPLHLARSTFRARQWETLAGMVALIAHPFRLGYNGAVATVEEGTDAHYEQHLHLIVGTRVGEREMAWMYGVQDFTWSDLTADDIQTVVDTYGPDGLVVDSVTMTPQDDVTSTADVSWSRDDAQDVT